MKSKNLVELLWIFKCSFEKDSSVKVHQHQHHYLLLYFLDGKALFVKSGEQFQFAKGQCVLVQPGEMHGITRVLDQGAKWVEVKFLAEDDFIRRMLRELPRSFQADSLTTGLVDAIISTEAHPRSMQAQHIGDSYLLSLIYHILDVYCHPYADIGALGHDTALPDAALGFSAATRDIIAYLRENYRRKLSLDDIADTIKYNKNYICKLFKNETGQTINEYLVNLRIREAEKLITFSHYSLVQIAQNTGFGSINHFNRTFKKKVGVPPGLYKRLFPENKILSDLGSITLSPENLGSLSASRMLDFTE